MDKIRLALVDDDLLIVSLLSDFLQQDATLDVVFTATDGYVFLDYINSGVQPQPDILILDLKMGAIGGMEIIATLKALQTEIKIMVVSSHYQESSIKFMMEQGVVAFLPKGVSPQLLKNVVGIVARQGFYWDDDQKRTIASLLQKKSAEPVMDIVAEMSSREIEILKLLCFQKTAKEIGELLFISSRTVEGHKSNLLSKIGVKNVMGLIVFALQNNIVVLEEIPLI